MYAFRILRHGASFALGVVVTVAVVLVANRGDVDAQQRPFVGGVAEESGTAPVAVRNDVAQPADPIVTLRHFRIEKGHFEEFHKASREGVWPFFEKIGSRVVGMWVQIHPEDSGTESPADYDDVYLMTRYASVDHWRATRDMATLGGNGPDWQKCREALAFRRTLTKETSLTFLKGDIWHSPPQFLPGLVE